MKKEQKGTASGYSAEYIKECQKRFLFVFGSCEDIQRNMK
jgi:hypothetical protein